MKTLMLGDCLEKLNDIPDNAVDLIVADMPYGVTQLKWDTQIPLEGLWKQLYRVSKKTTPIILFGTQPFSSMLVTSNFNGFKYSWVWQKNKVTGHLNAKRRPMVSHEDILVFCQGTPKYYPQMTSGHKPMNHATNNDKSNRFGKTQATKSGGRTTRYPKSILSSPVVNNSGSGEIRVHPSQKPEGLLEYLIKTYSKEGCIVLDFVMGSGSTGMACHTLGRRFIGIEADKNIFGVAKKRLEI